jgi:tRNA-dihydrouridine synthase B
MLRVGDVTLRTNLLLAPIAGYCDLAFRLVVRGVPEAAAGVGTVGLACTDLLCPHAILKENEKTLWLAATCPEDSPVCMQLYGRHPDVLADAARWAQAHGATTIDINMGCPVDKVTKKNGGSMLLCEPGLAVDIVRTVSRAVTVPVTAKIRLGWDDHRLITTTLPVALADAGARLITVHGRTTEQMFKGTARLEGIAQVVHAVARRHPDVPVIGNGDVKTPQDARRMIDTTGCAGVMIGRGALGQPWVFRDTAHYLCTGRLPEPYPHAARVACVVQHFENLLRFRDERIALNTIKRRMSWYSPHLQPWPMLKKNVQDIDSADAFRDFMHAGPPNAAALATAPATAAAAVC